MQRIVQLRLAGCQQARKVFWYPYFITSFAFRSHAFQAHQQESTDLAQSHRQPVPDTEYFEVSAANGRIVLTPLRRSRSDEVREKLAKLGITDQDVKDAVRWARGRR